MQLSNMSVSDLAKQAVDDFIDNGNLNLSIAKLAKEHELTPTQIQRIIESANHEAYGREYKVAKDKCFAMDLADLNTVLQHLGTAPQNEKTASEEVDDFFNLEADKKVKVAMEVLPANFRRGGAKASKDASIHMLTTAAAKMGEYLRELRTEKTACVFRQKDNFLKFTKEARRLMLEDGISIQEMFSATKHAGFVPDDIALAVFKDAVVELTKAANAVERKLLQFNPTDTKEMGMKVVNGNQPLFIHLRATAGDAVNRCLINYGDDVTSQCLSGIVSAIHTLRTDDDVKKYIEEEVQPFANNVQKGIKFAAEHILAHAADEKSWLAKHANWKEIAKLLDQIGRVFSVTTQGTKGIESAGSSVSNYVKSLAAPAMIRPGFMAGMAGAK